MDIEATKAKLAKLNEADLKALDEMVQLEVLKRERSGRYDRIRTLSNRTHSSGQQAQGLREFFDNAARQH